MRTSSRWIALAASVLVLGTSLASAEPIIKPRKYHGPIPQSMLWLRAGFFGGASNEEMNTYLDGLVNPPFEEHTEDFGTAFALDAGYAHKVHPQFALRLNASISFLSSKSDGNKALSVAGVDTLVAVNYDREFKSEVIVLEASGIYFFSDASVQEFQTYIGGGFSVGIPHESFEEVQNEFDTGQHFQTIESSEWGVSPGVHAVLGAIYYVTNTIGVTTEGRLQLMESRYEQLTALNEVDELEEVSFVVDYSGFYITVGVLWGF